jgi:hypothetical protein
VKRPLCAIGLTLLILIICFDAILAFSFRKPSSGVSYFGITTDLMNTPS